MKKRIIALVMIALFLVVVVPIRTVCTAEEPETLITETIVQIEPTVEIIEEPKPIKITYELHVELKTDYSISELPDLIQQCQEALNEVYSLEATYGIDLSIKERSISFIMIKYQEELDKWEERESEYPIATEIWLYMRDELGWNDTVCAGILGNMMIEAGGYSLCINPYAYNAAGYYGICQWSTGYHSGANGQDLQGQLEYMVESLEWDFMGGCYQSGFTFEDFLAMDNPEEASVAFAKCYERCAAPYGRQSCARTAYEYFVG